MSYYDIKIKLKLFLSEKQTMINQDFDIMNEMALRIWGGKKNTAQDIPQTKEEAAAMFRSLGIGRAM